MGRTWFSVPNSVASANFVSKYQLSFRTEKNQMNLKIFAKDLPNFLQELQPRSQNNEEGVLAPDFIDSTVSSCYYLLQTVCACLNKKFLLQKGNEFIEIGYLGGASQVFYVELPTRKVQLW